MRIEQQQLRAFLLDSELVSAADIEKAEKEAGSSGKKIDEILLSQKKVSESDIARVKAYILGIPFVNLEGEKIDPKILEIIPEPIAKKNNIIAFKKNGTSLEVEFGDIIKGESQALAQVAKDSGVPVDVEELKKIAEDLPIIRIVDTLIRHAILGRASDV